MHTLERNDLGTLKHLVKQGGFLLKLHLAEFAKDPTSRATESSRSNLMAVRHTVKQVYGSAVEVDVADLVKLTAPAMTESQILFSWADRWGSVRSRHGRKNQLHYIAGADAKAAYAMRLQLGDEAFHKAIAQHFLGDAPKGAYLANAILWAADPGMRDAGVAFRTAEALRCSADAMLLNRPYINHVANDDEECFALVELPEMSEFSLLAMGLRATEGDKDAEALSSALARPNIFTAGAVHRIDRLLLG
jgi:hypothetical protein